MYTLNQIKNSPLYDGTIVYVYKKNVDNYAFMPVISGVRLGNLDKNGMYELYKHNEVVKIYPLANQSEPAIKVLIR